MTYIRLRADPFSDYDITKRPTLPDKVSFTDGQRLDEALLPSPLEFEVNHPFDVPLEHMIGLIIPVVSKYFVEQLVKAGVDNIQTFPAALSNPTTGQSWDSHVALNILTVLDAVDMDASDFQVVMDGPGDAPPLVGFQEIVIDAERAAGHRIFRLAQETSVIIGDSAVLDVLKGSKPEKGWGIHASVVQSTAL